MSRKEVAARGARFAGPPQDPASSRFEELLSASDTGFRTLATATLQHERARAPPAAAERVFSATESSRQRLLGELATTLTLSAAAARKPDDGRWRHSALRLLENGAVKGVSGEARAGRLHASSRRMLEGLVLGAVSPSRMTAKQDQS
jgi:hypothetical protein